MSIYIHLQLNEYVEGFTAMFCMLYRKLEKELQGGRTHFVDTCGLPISTYFSARNCCG